VSITVPYPVKKDVDIKPQRRIGFAAMQERVGKLLPRQRMHENQPKKDDRELLRLAPQLASLDPATHEIHEHAKQRELRPPCGAGEQISE
jgi:hypothetical protein